MPRIEERIINEVLARTSVVDVVSDYTRLTKAGSSYKGLCPFHNEKTPSFFVNEDKKLYKCFGCSEGGNIFQFVMKKEGMGFSEAVEKLAKRVGIEIKKVEEKVSFFQPYFDINRKALDYFKRNLGKDEITYLEKRGLTKQYIEKFEIGFAPEGWDGYLNTVKASENKIKTSLELGLLKKRKESSGYYDSFRGRIMFPVHSISGDVLGFGGRIIGEGEPKYLNSPESPIYKKSEILYGLHIAKDAVRKKDFIIVCEGYLDCISLIQHGFENSVCLSGTALTEKHLNLVRRYTKKVLFILDADRAGISAMLRAFRILAKCGMEGKVVILPKGDDPNSFLTKKGAQEFKKFLAKRIHILDFYFKFHARNLNSISDKLKLAEDVFDIIRQVQDEVERELLLKKVEELTDVESSIIRRTFEQFCKGDIYKRAVTEEKSGKNYPATELVLAKLLLLYKDYTDNFISSDLLSFFTNEDLKRTVDVIISERKSSGEITPEILLGHVDDDNLCGILTEVVWSGEIKEENAKKTYEDCKSRILSESKKMKLQELQAKIHEAEKNKNEVLKLQLLHEKQSYLKEQP